MTLNLEHGHKRGSAKAATIVIVLALAAATGLLWAWNEVAVSLIGVPAAQFKHSFAIVAALLLFMALAKRAARLF